MSVKVLPRRSGTSVAVDLALASTLCHASEDMFVLLMAITLDMVRLHLETDLVLPCDVTSAGGRSICGQPYIMMNSNGRMRKVLISEMEALKEERFFTSEWYMMSQSFLVKSQTSLRIMLIKELLQSSLIWTSQQEYLPWKNNKK
ncbi:unnamed protein product [Porites evermanni]|uniref:Uncharacterized protein n=1 Tax=Porites evermanni TaxID=104178 RepID=A0ABN8MV71_9CNID|nr:unnamed protein product [Porites evermanni]